MKLKQIAANVVALQSKDGCTEVVFSYETPVAALLPGVGRVKTEKKWSATTSRHINKAGYKDAQTVPQDTLDDLNIYVS